MTVTQGWSILKIVNSVDKHTGSQCITFSISFFDLGYSSSLTRTQNRLYTVYLSFESVCSFVNSHRYMAKMFPIRRITQDNQFINQ